MAETPQANFEINAKYVLEIDNVSIMSFEKLTLGDSEWGVLEGRAGTDPLYKTLSSGIKTATNLTIEKHMRVGGTSEVQELINWHNSGSKDRRSGAVVVQDRDGAELMRVEFNNGWLSKLTPPELDAAADNSPLMWTFDLAIGEYKVV